MNAVCLSDGIKQREQVGSYYLCIQYEDSRGSKEFSSELSINHNMKISNISRLREFLNL